MEKRINGKISTYFHNFKEDIKNKINNKISNEDLLQFIYDYDPLELNNEDFSKRQRTKNTVPLYIRCCALRANKEQCTRRKKNNNDFCGTHIKGRPYGEITNITNDNKIKEVIAIAKEIQGIIYYIDDNNNVYDTHQIMQNKKNPDIIAKYVIDKDGNYTIPSIFNN